MKTKEIPKDKSNKELLIAHACGVYNNMVYVNSLEAFYENYEKGFRRFEIDMLLTKEDGLISYHSVMGYNFMPESCFEKITPRLIVSALGEISLVTDTRFFLLSKDKIEKAYKKRALTPITAILLAKICRKYPDVSFILDTKSTNPNIYLRQYTMLKEAFVKIGSNFSQIIPQFYNLKMAKRSLDEIGFSSAIYTLYKEVFIESLILKKLEKAGGITSITISKERLLRHLNFIKKLHEIGIGCNVHTLTSPEEINFFRQLGIDGIYSHVSPNELKLNR